MIDKEKFKERIISLIGQRSLREVAKAADCDPKTIRNAIDGKIPGVEILDKLLAGRYSISWLLGETDQRQTGKIEAKIEPGNDRQASRIADQAKRATISNEALRLVVEWMDTYFAQHPDQAILFMVDLREQYDSFRDFMEKKREGGAVENRLQSKVSNSDR